MSQFLTEEIVEGVTFLRLNIDIQPDDEKCKVFLKNEESQAQSLDPDEACLWKTTEGKKYIKQKWAFQFFNEIDVSTEQQKEIQLSMLNLVKETKGLFFQCFIDSFNEL